MGQSCGNVLEIFQCYVDLQRFEPTDGARIDFEEGIVRRRPLASHHPQVNGVGL